MLEVETLAETADWTVPDDVVVVEGQLLATVVAVVYTKWVELISWVTVTVDRYLVIVSVKTGDVGP